MEVENEVMRLKIGFSRLHRVALGNISTTMHLIAAISQIEGLSESSRGRVHDAMIAVNDQMAALQELDEVINVGNNDGEH